MTGTEIPSRGKMLEIENLRPDEAFLYVRLADSLERKIMAGTFKAGERLPSIRQLHQELGLSISTIYKGYIELEKRGRVEARTKSGYYVKAAAGAVLPSPVMVSTPVTPRRVTLGSLNRAIVASINEPGVLPLGCAVAAPELMPSRQFSRSLRALTTRDMHELMNYGCPAGHPELIRQLGKRLIGVNPGTAENETVVTSGGCMEALSLCLRAVTRPGDAVVVESPAHFGTLQLMEDMGLMALGVPVDPLTGIDLALLEKALETHEVKACLLVPNFHNPMGCLMPDEHKERLVSLVTGRGIPIIEDDIYGDLYFGDTRPSPLKAFDRRRLVLYCSSFSKTLAPGMRVGWTLAGRFAPQVLRLKLNSTLPAPNLNQLVIADFLKSGSYDRHLRRLRLALKRQVHDTSLAIARSFPAGTRITTPAGGFVLWLELPARVDSLDLYHRAMAEKISIIPGVIYGNFRNFIRISCGHPWSERIEKGIRRLGEMSA